MCVCVGRIRGGRRSKRTPRIWARRNLRRRPSPHRKKAIGEILKFEDGLGKTPSYPSSVASLGKVLPIEVSSTPIESFVKRSKDKEVA